MQLNLKGAPTIKQSRRQRGGSGARHPIFEICAHHFTFGLLVAACIQCSVLKMWPPLLVFGSSFWFLPPAAKSWRWACHKGVSDFIVEFFVSTKIFSEILI